jgi:hypothetical protein
MIVVLTAMLCVSSHAETEMNVEQWLSEIQMEEYAPAFMKNAITTHELLISLTEEDLSGIGVAALGHRKKIVAAIENLKKNGWTPKWSTAFWLKKIGQERYIENFQNNAITSKDLVVSLTENNLESMGISILGHRKAIMAGIETLKVSSSAPPVGNEKAAAQPNAEKEQLSAPTGNVVVEVHQSHTGTNLWYHVGVADPNTKTVAWGESQKYDQGQAPMCDFDGSTVVEVHQGHDDTQLWYRIGTVNEQTKTIAWGSSVNYDIGQTPIVAFHGDLVVEMHQSHEGTNLWYHVGTLNRTTQTINWGESQKFDQGRIPSIGLSETGTNVVVEVHQSHEGTNLWYHVGTADPSGKTILWGESIRYDQGALPMCDFNGDRVVEVHQGHDDVQLWYRVGEVDEKTKTIHWGSSINYDRGQIPTVALNGNMVIEMHQSHEGTNLWYKVGILDAKAQTIFWGPGQKFDQGRIPSIGF